MKNFFQFHGRGGEYFGIWIVNILLTIVTLGLYSPWAHVRTKQYFYGNTELAGERFEYLATGKQIFMGRLIAGGLFVIYLALGNTVPVIAYAILAFMMLAYPWVIQRSLRFNARMTRYRGVRLGFNGTIKNAYLNFLGRPAVAYIIVGLYFALWRGLMYLMKLGSIEQIKAAGGWVALLGLLAFAGFLYLVVRLYAWVKRGIDAYIHNGYRYGEQQFSATLQTSVYNKIYWKIAGMLFGFVVLAVVLIGGSMAISDGHSVSGLLVFVLYIGFFVVMTFIKASALANVRFYTYGQTQIGQSEQYHFESTVKAWDYTKLLIGNGLLLMFTLGLATPMVKVSVAAFMAKHTALKGDIEQMVANELDEKNSGSTSDALGDVFDIDVQF